ncbi:MAG: OmpA family protein [Verrucomicrobia bacterium]|jgi:chemotaxis protein MotB|nr:OmpA family protein [Verrucomicrobiota bacterium]MDI9381380.1 OmpA family protein [Verrucomicrobiota bacterium]NMD20643.1 OmpA family protein [Verrucomicrobiota bacterium]HNV00021.1 OmpA family protein [Verrucomicrobiota bacterium]HOA62815.1 OmpA family protein [Verrucomicrobiota bacterium]
MPKQAWAVAMVLTALVALGLGGLAYWHRGLELAEERNRATQARSEATRARSEAIEAHAGAAEAEMAAATNRTRVAELETALAQAQQTLDDLRRQTEQHRQNQQSLEAEFRRALESKEITISELQGKLTVDILDRILFDSGEAELKTEGQEILRKVAAVLAQHPKRRIHVIGHTDNVPIRASARARYPSNWELSTARALAAVRFLIDEAGVDPQRLGAVGYGEFRPLADNATPEGRAKNRRIAIVVLSDELVGSDATPPAPLSPPPPAETPDPGSTNAPPVIPSPETRANS